MFIIMYLVLPSPSLPKYASVITALMSQEEDLSTKYQHLSLRILGPTDMANLEIGVLVSLNKT